MVDLGDWNERLAPLFSDEKYLNIRKFLIEEYRKHIVYPNMYDLYNCFKYTQFHNLRVVILGQDPYHGPNQAHGLCFSVQDGIPNPPHLKIYSKNYNRTSDALAPKTETLPNGQKKASCF